MTTHLSPLAVVAPPSAKPWALAAAGLAVFHGLPATPRLFHYFLPRLFLQGKRVLCFDGGNRFDPLLIARLARSSGKAPSDFNSLIRVARAFTCFQFTEMLIRAQRLLQNFPADVLILTALPDLYFDEDVQERAAFASFCQALAALRSLRPLSLGVAVFSDASSFKTPRLNLFQQLTAQAEYVSKFSEGPDSKLALSVQKSPPQASPALC